MKAISSAAAAVIIATISITLVGTTYFFSKSLTERAIAETFEIVDIFQNRIIVRNTGTQPISKFKTLIDGKEVDNEIKDPPIQPQSVGTVNVSLEGISPGRHQLTLISRSMSQTWTWHFEYVTPTPPEEITEEVLPPSMGEASIEANVETEQGTAEVGKPVKWTSRISFNNPSPVDIQNYLISFIIPEDASNVEIKDEEARTMSKEASMTLSIASKETKNYILEYETPAPYKEESVIKPFVQGKRYRKRINVKTNFTGYYGDIPVDTEVDFTNNYENVKAYTDIPEELSEEDYTIRLYHVSGGSRLDVTDLPIYNVYFTDSDDDNLVDRVEWNVPYLNNQSSQTFDVEASLTIINVQSYPTVGGNWTVRFITNGTADLIITPVEGTTWTNYSESGYDLKFLELKCGDTVLNPGYNGTSVVYKNYNCDEIGYEISKVLTSGKHTLEFRFGDDVKYAYNQAEYLKIEWGRVTVMNEDWTLVNLVNTYTNPIVIVTAEYPGNTEVARAAWTKDVTPNSFKVKVDEFGEIGNPVVFSGTTSVHYIVMEEGNWTMPGSGTKIEAGKINTTLVGYRSNNYYCGTNGVRVDFLNTFSDANPLVIASRATEENIGENGWAEIWVSDPNDRRTDVGNQNMCIGLDRNYIGNAGNFVNDETIHYIVMDSGIGSIDGINFEVLWRASANRKWVEGCGDSPPYVTAWTQTFSAAPEVIVAGTTKVRGGDGSHTVVYDSNQNYLRLCEDEEITSNSRSHPAEESAGAIAFETSGSYTSAGWLNVTLLEPDPSVCNVTSPCNKTQYETFWIDATVECKSGFCGSVEGLTRYNSSDSVMGPIDTTEGIIPLYANAVLKNDSFEDDAVGSDPSGWSVYEGGGSVNVVDYPVSYGSRSLELNDTSPTNSVGITHSFLFVLNNATVYWSAYANQTDANFLMRLTIIGTNIVEVRFNSSGYIEAVNGSSTSFVNLMPYNAGEWYEFKVKLKGTKYDVWINDVLLGEDLDTVDYSFFTLLRFTTDDGTTGKFYLDWITLTSAFNRQTCLDMDSGDICNMTWIVNATGSPGEVYMIDANFSSSYPGVEDKNTSDAYIRISYPAPDTQFRLEMFSPSCELTNYTPTETEPGVLTTEIEFNFTTLTDINREPCVRGTTCCQDSTYPIWKFYNTGNVDEIWEIQINESVPGVTIEFSNSTPPNPDEYSFSQTGWNFVGRVNQGQSLNISLYADVGVGNVPGSHPRTFTHRSSPA